MLDRYSKAVLTVIALALVALVAQNAVRSSVAETTDVQKVQICDGQNCARLSPIVENMSGKIVTRWGLAVVPEVSH